MPKLLEMISLERVYNFNPGPATLPEEVLREVQAEFLNFDSTGMSIVEISHRSKSYEKVHNAAKATILELMGLGDDYAVLFIQGGASLQFAMIPLNFATKDKPGAYVLSGTFSSNAYKEAQTLGVGEVAASTKDENFCRVPRQDELKSTRTPRTCTCATTTRFTARSFITSPKRATCRCSPTCRATCSAVPSTLNVSR